MVTEEEEAEVAQAEEEAAVVAAEVEVAHQESECEGRCLLWQHHHTLTNYLLCSSG